MRWDGSEGTEETERGQWWRAGGYESTYLFSRAKKEEKKEEKKEKNYSKSINQTSQVPVASTPATSGG